MQEQKNNTIAQKEEQIKNGSENQINILPQQKKQEQMHQPKQMSKLSSKLSVDFFVVHNPKPAVKPVKVDPKPFDKNKLTISRKSAINPQQINRMRISSDQVICKDQDATSLCHSVTCPICLMVMQLPYYECQGCSNGFCTICLQNWWKKSPNSCAYKCQNVQFKQVKRSNTYNAVLNMLKIKCSYCCEQITIAQINNHIIKQCPSVIETCRLCQKKFPRKQIEQHQNQLCEQKPWKCEHCQIQYCYIDRNNHDQVCLQKQSICKYPDCGKQIKRKNQYQHNKKCDHKILSCQWCNKQMKQKQYQIHAEKCEKRLIKCLWCSNQFKIQQSQQHQNSCLLRKQSCGLCHQMKLINQLKQHKFQCMFLNLIQIKSKNQSLENQNIRLKQKIMILQGILQENIANSRSSALKVVSQMKQQDKQIVQKDLLRLDNSIKSVQKLRKQQFTNHMKFPHLIQSWCPICRQLQKKFKAMLQPLLQQRKETLAKMQQIQRFSFTPK